MGWTMLILKILIISTVVISSLSASPIDPKKYNEPVRVACIGDSITQGSGTKGNPYPALLQKMLGAQWKVGNFGVSGRTLLRKGDYPYWNEKAYQNALTFKPDIVIIMLGTNDTKPQNWAHEKEFVSDYRDLVKSFLELASKPQVFICRPCPVVGKGNFGITEENIEKEIPRIDTLAKEMRLGVIDMHAALKDKPELIPDRVHPNAGGAGEMAKTAFKALTGKEAPEPAAAK